MKFAPEYQVKQYLARVRGEFGWFDVLATGNPKVVLFRAIAGDTNGLGGYFNGLEFPVTRTSLKRGVLPPRR